jgi:hypothetical protein
MRAEPPPHCIPGLYTGIFTKVIKYYLLQFYVPAHPPSNRVQEAGAADRAYCVIENLTTYRPPGKSYSNGNNHKDWATRKTFNPFFRNHFGYGYSS